MPSSVKMNGADMHRIGQEFSTWNSIPVSRAYVEEYSLNVAYISRKDPHHRKPCNKEALRVTGNSRKNTRIATKS
jgi:hypothetical protein